MTDFQYRNYDTRLFQNPQGFLPDQSRIINNNKYGVFIKERNTAFLSETDNRAYKMSAGQEKYGVS